MHSRKSPEAPAWKRPSKSGTGPDSNCVEVAHVGNTIAIRDSKLNTIGDFPTLVVPANEWISLIKTARNLA